MKKLPLFLFYLLCAVSLFAQSGGFVSTPIPIASWTLGYGSNLTKAPNGVLSILAGPSMFSLDLGVSPATVQAIPGRPGYFHDGTYMLKFSALNQLTVYPGYWEAKVSFGTQELCSFDGWGTQRFREETFPCESPGYLINGNSLPGGGTAQGNSNLVITFSVDEEAAQNAGWPMYFNNGSVAFTPAN